jgi:hypothetical protein
MKTPRYATQRVKHRALVLALLKEHGPMTYKEIAALTTAMTIRQVYVCVDNCKTSGVLVNIVPGGARKAAVVGLPEQNRKFTLEQVWGIAA